MLADVALVLLLVGIVTVSLLQARRKPVPKVFTPGPRVKRLFPNTTESWRTTMMSEPANTPFRHEAECKMQDAEPQWYPIGNGHHERVCACRKEISYPPRWRRPDPLDPKQQRHNPNCRLLKIDGIAEKPEIYEAWVTLKVESTYTFATCNSCGNNWYAYDQPPEKVEATT